MRALLLLLLFPVSSSVQEPATRPADSLRSGAYEERIREAIALGAREDFPAAEAVLIEALALAPERSEAHLKLGALHLRVRRYADAARAFERGLSLDPSAIGDCPWIGHAYYEIGELEKAEAWYGRVLAASPENLEAKRGLASTLHRKGEDSRAEALFREIAEKAKRGAPGAFDAHRHLGEILLARGDASGSILEFERAKAEDPFAPEAAYGLARALARAGETARAEEERARFDLLSKHAQEIEALRARLRADPRDLDSLAGIAAHLSAIGDFAGAERTLRRGVGLAPGDPVRRIALADFLESRSRFDEARRVLEEAALLFPEEPVVFEKGYRFHRARGDFDGMYRAAEIYHKLTGRSPR